MKTEKQADEKTTSKSLKRWWKRVSDGNWRWEEQSYQTEHLESGPSPEPASTPKVP